MAVLTSRDNKELIISCNCGCEEGVHIRIDSGYDYHFLTYTNGHFYSDQYGVINSIKEKTKKIWAIIRNKDYYYSDVIMDKEQLEQFKEFVNKVK